MVHPFLSYPFQGEEEREVPDEESEPPEKKGDKENEDSVPSDSDDDDDVNITIGEILNPTAPYSRVGFGRMPSLLTPGGQFKHFKGNFRKNIA